MVWGTTFGTTSSKAGDAVASMDKTRARWIYKWRLRESGRVVWLVGGHKEG
jgi:hypothetical protein